MGSGYASSVIFLVVSVYFQSFGELIAMDGHGFYVWSAYLISAALIVYALVSPIFKSREIKENIKLVQKIKASRISNEGGDNASA